MSAMVEAATHWYTNIAVPIGVVIGATVGGIASYFGARAAGKANVRAQIEAAKHARTLAFDGRLWEKCSETYEELVELLNSYTPSSLMELDVAAKVRRDGVLIRRRVDIYGSQGLQTALGEYLSSLGRLVESLTSLQENGAYEQDAADAFVTHALIVGQNATVVRGEIRIHLESFGGVPGSLS